MTQPVCTQPQQLAAVHLMDLCGLTADHASSLASAGYGITEFVPLGWVALPIDEHLASIGGDH